VSRLLLFVPTAVVFIVWMVRGYRRLPSLGVRPALEAGWAVGGWFLPVANLFVPVVVMAQLNRVARGPNDLLAEPVRFRGLIAMWWTTWLVSGLLVLASIGEARTHGLQALYRADLVRTGSELAAVVSGIAAIALVRVVTSRLSAPGSALQPAPSVAVADGRGRLAGARPRQGQDDRHRVGTRPSA
jgi:hypothetical protein